MVKGLASNYSEYVLLSTPELLTQIIDVKKKYGIESRLIYLGSAS